MNRFLLVISLFCLLTNCNRPNSNKSIKKNQKIETQKIITAEKGVFYCIECNSSLYKSENNYGSNNYDESFDKSIDGKVHFDKDYKIKKNKTDLICKQCGAKLGNVWDDGPESTGNRHCVTKNALIFKTLEINK